MDPKFTKSQKAEEQTCFMGNDFGGFEEPVNPTKWPYVRKEVRDLFKVTEDCHCDGTKETKYIDPANRLTQIGAFRPFYEPVGSKQIKKQQVMELCYQGDDFGGHNIPTPHPTPPKPDSYYEDAFIKIDEYLDDQLLL